MLSIVLTRRRRLASMLLGCLMLVSAAAVLLRPVAAHADSASPIAAFDWSMPDRSVDANHDGFIDSYYNSADTATSYQANACCSVPPQQIDPAGWQVNVDACASLASSSDSPITNYAFSMAGTVLSSGPNCQQVLTFPTQGTYTVDLTVTDAAGGTGSTSLAVSVKDLLVVALGDSYGSGEGNPPYQDWRCERSSQAAAAQAAERLEQSSRHFSVTFIHLACSGARILDSDPSDTEFLGGILDPYQGQHPRTAPSGTIVPLNSQIDDLKALMGHRKVDALLLSGGANDLGLIDILNSCIDQSFVTAPVAWLLIPDCYRHIPGLDTQGVDIFNRGMSSLAGRYDQLGKALNALTVIDPATGHAVPAITPEHVYFMEYPDPTRDQNGDYCGLATDLPGLDQAEWKWASESVLGSLNQAAGQSAGHFGWNYVGGIATDFNLHGYCSTDHWVVRFAESQQDPHDFNDTLHPNLQGQNDVATRLTATVLDDLASPPQPPTITLRPVLVPFLVSTMGAQGWFTGECAPVIFGGGCDRNQVVATLFLIDPVGVADPLSSSVTLTFDGQPVTLNPGSNATCSLPAGSLASCDIQAADGNASGIKSLIVVFRIHDSGVHHVALTATNLQGRVISKSFPIAVDLGTPAISPIAVQGTAGQQGWYRSPVDLTFSASSASAVSGPNRIDALLLGEGANGAAAILSTSGDPRAGAVTAHVTGEGEHHLSTEAVDNAEIRSGDALDSNGKPVGAQLTDIKIDTLPPSLNGTPDRSPDRNGWYRHDVTVHFTASDPTPGSGVDGSSLTPDVVLAEGASQGVNGSVSDVAGNFTNASAGPFSIDETPPAVSITAPSNGTYTLNQAATVHYTCADALSGVDSCSGSVPDGGLLDTGSPGTKTFTVQAMDRAGNTVNRSVSYVVAYGVCALYDQARAVHAGANVPIKLSLCDANGNNVSSAGVVVTATALTLVSGTASGALEDSGNANPDSNFRFEATLATGGGYIYNLSTKGLTTGTYAVNFVAGVDPTIHRVMFQIR